jgi:aryl-alcohol dehydrogenase-like predicted oxidoreductase
MEYTKLTHTDLVISRLGFGCEPLGGTDWGEVDTAAAAAAVSRALELGITCFDTADVYGLGRSEQRLSQALGHRRHDVVIVSKCGVNWQPHANGERAKTFLDASPGRIQQALENSLRRLRLDCIPLYLIHWPDPRTPVAETLGMLRRCQEAGKIRYIGVSNFPVPVIRQANHIVRLAVVELSYSLLERQAEAEFFPCCQELGLNVFAYGPLAQGLLTGKYGYETRFAPDDRRHRLSHFQEPALQKNLQRFERMRGIGMRYHKSPTQTAIRWVLEHPAISCAIVGAKSPAQIEENAGALDWHLSQEDWQDIAND